MLCPVNQDGWIRAKLTKLARGTGAGEEGGGGGRGKGKKKKKV